MTAMLVTAVVMSVLVPTASAEEPPAGMTTGEAATAERYKDTVFSEVKVTKGTTSSDINVRAGQNAASLVIVPVGTDGTVAISTNTGSIDIAVDVAGWFG